MSFATDERHQLADLLFEVGPLAPTLCEGWDAFDLVAHLFVRENRTAKQLMVMMNPRLRDEMLLRAAKQQYGFAALVRKFREGPQGASPFRLPFMENFANTAELFIHHEDVRRAGADPLPPRTFDDEGTKALTKALKRMAPLALRKAPFGVDLLLPSEERIAVKRHRRVGIAGEPGEILLYIAGRTSVAQVDVSAKPEDVERLERSLGF